MLPFLATSLVLVISTTPAYSDELPRRGLLGAGFGPVPEARAKELSLKPGDGVEIQSALPNLTAAQAGLRSGDILLAINGSPIAMATLGATARSLVGGQPVSFSIIRDGKKQDIKSTMVEKPRDPGNANYEVSYSHIVSNGKKMRTIITRPKTAGKHPGFFFIQGFSPISYDFKLEGSTGDVTTLDGPLLYHFANSGYVTMRVEKPGVGDSEGGPFAELDYTTELDIYRQALKQLKEEKSVDQDNVFIFGHSMGGAFGPMVACENPVKGIVVYGTASRTWFEYLLDTVRYQGLLSGDSFENTDETMRQTSRLMALVFLEKQSVADVKKAHPELAAYADALIPGGLFNGKTLDFWRQLNQTNFPKYWAKCGAYVLAVHGASDFVTYDADHKLIADVVNSVKPGYGSWEIIPKSDHVFHDFATEAESIKAFTKGKFNNAFTLRMAEWMAGIQAKK